MARTFGGKASVENFDEGSITLKLYISNSKIDMFIPCERRASAVLKIFCLRGQTPLNSAAGANSAKLRCGGNLRYSYKK